MRVLFIDADGCLHPEPARVGLGRLCWLPVLVDMLRDYDDVRVVLHSSWRLAMPERFIAQLLAPLGEKFLGVTAGAKRYESILAWLEQHPAVSSCRILDDMPREFPSPPPAELVLCESREGITGARVQQQLRDWLEETAASRLAALGGRAQDVELAPRRRGDD